MGKTTIAWTEKSWNCIRGCSRVSEGCRFCYAERQAARFSADEVLEPSDPVAGRSIGVVSRAAPFHGFAEMRNGEPRWTGKVALIPEKLDEPLRWKKPSRVFVNSMSDLFHEKLNDIDIASVWAVMALAPRHTFQILTKRPKRMLEWLTTQKTRGYGDVLAVADRVLRPRFPEAWKVGISNPGAFPAPWIWLGVSIEDQKTADERIPLLLQTPAAVRFVSYEPALGPVNFEKETLVLTTRGVRSVQPLYCGEMYGVGKISWVIVGGESGPHARPFDVAWARSTIKACREAGTACFIKQLGARPYRAHPITKADEDCPPFWSGGWDRVGLECQHRRDGPDIVPKPPATVRPARTLVLTDKKGGDPSEWPEDLRIRQYPTENRS